MSDLENALRETFADQARLAPPPRVTRQLVRRARLRRARTGLVAGLVTATMVVAGVWTAHALQPDPVRPVHVPRPVSVPTVPSELAYVARATDLMVLHPDGTRTTWLTTSSLNPPGCGDGCGAFRTLAWSPDGSRLALVYTRTGQGWNENGAVYVARPGSPRLTRVAACPDRDAACDRINGSGLTWSPDGSRIAVAGDGSIWVAPVDGTQPFHRITGCRTCVDRQPAWSPDGTTIAFGSDDGVFEVDVRTGSRRFLAPATVDSPVWSPDGTHLVTSGGGGAYLVDAVHPLAQPPLVSAPQGPNEGPSLPSWSPDGSELVWFTTPGHENAYVPEVWITRLAAHRDQPVFRGPCCVGSFTPAVWSPDGRKIAIGLTWDGGTTGGVATFLIDVGGGPLVRLGRGYDFSWRPPQSG